MSVLLMAVPDEMLPGAVPSSAPPDPVVEVCQRLIFPLAPTSVWDVIVRGEYIWSAAKLREQATRAFEAGLIRTQEEIPHWIGQREALRQAMQSRLSPVGRWFSKWIETARTASERIGRAEAKLIARRLPHDQRSVYRAVVKSLGNTNLKVNTVTRGGRLEQFQVHSSAGGSSRV